MAKWSKLIITTFIVTSLITGCGSNNAAPNVPESQNAGTHQPQEQAAPPPEQEPEQQEEIPADSDEQTQKPEPSEAPDAEAVIEKTYYMNKNYFIKPIDENGEKNVVLLTFDDGPKEKEMLTSILDTLDKHQAKAIFFVNGFRVKQNPDLLKLIDERGQIVGNHSYDHIVLRKESEEKIDQQLEDTQRIVQETIGKAPEFFRPPNGAGNDYIQAKAKELGMLYMTWSNGSLDWADNQHNPQGVIDSVLEQLHPGSNILMHELPWTAEALDQLLTELESLGYGFVDPRAIELEAR